jgi:hypothetical protein
MGSRQSEAELAEATAFLSPMLWRPSKMKER